MICGVCTSAAVLVLGPPAGNTQTVAPPVPEGRQRIHVVSTIDGSQQDSYLILPPSGVEPGVRRPLAVLLHTWSYDPEQRQPELEAEAAARGWILLAPNFRGRNDHPEACGSKLAQQDILDAVAWVRRRYAVDEKRVYVLGMSGGGFMTMLMAARYPQIWAAASAWIGISDLRVWYGEHKSDDYGAMMRACFGGSPEDNKRTAARYREQSPITYLRPGLRVPLDLAAGKDDPTVSALHTLRAFRAVAPGALSEVEIRKVLANEPTRDDAGSGIDALIGRRILLHRTAGTARVTIFDGKHEWFPRAAAEWLAQHQRR